MPAGKGSLLIQPVETVITNVQSLPVYVVLVVTMMPDGLHAVFPGKGVTDVIQHLSRTATAHQRRCNGARYHQKYDAYALTHLANLTLCFPVT